jgi:hypothetical protein
MFASFTSAIRVTLPHAVPSMSKRLLIYLLGVALGFVAPILSAKDIPHESIFTLRFWDEFAKAADQEGGFPDIILACLPAVYVCFTDFLDHVLDKDFSFKNRSTPYVGLMMILGILVLSIIFLTAAYVDYKLVVPEEKPWLGQFGNAWMIVKLVLLASFTFEVCLDAIKVNLELEREDIPVRREDISVTSATASPPRRSFFAMWTE